MDNSRDPLFGKIHGLAVGMLEGTLSLAEQQEFETLLLENPAARRAYLEHIQESACLRWLCVEEFEGAAEPVVPLQVAAKGDGSRRRFAAIFSSVILASIVAIIAGAQYWTRGIAEADRVAKATKAVKTPEKSTASGAAESWTPDNVAPADVAREVVATVTGLNGVQWAGSTNGAPLLSRCAVGDRLRMRAGSAELTFDAGVQVKVFGPADFEITSATSIRCLKGRVTTLVDKRGRGFSIQTPRAKVVDLGTQFGLAISETGETEVVVFQGAVDLSYSPKTTAGDTTSRRMLQGEAVLLKNSGEFERVVSVQRNSFMGAEELTGRRLMEPVIADVQDNIRKAERVKSYQVVHGGLEDDALAFVDRNHQWNGLDSTGLPPFLAGADYIMPFNDDKFVRGLEIKVSIVRPSTLYVFLDNNMAVPDWVKEGFSDTGVDIGLDCSRTEWHKDHSLGVGAGRSVDFQFSVWKREIKEPGTYTLGGLQAPKDRTQGFNMYGIAAVAKDELQLPVREETIRKSAGL